MSPEAARGEAPTPGMDVFAAGADAGRDALRARCCARRDALALRSTRAATKTCVLPARCRRGRRPAARHRACAPWHATRRGATPARRRCARRLQQWLQRRPARAAGAPRRQQRHARVPAAPHAPQERLPGAVRLGGAHPAHRQLRQREPGQPVARDPQGRGADQQAAAHWSTPRTTAQAGGGSISTVSRAVALVGFAGIRNMALRLVLLEHMQDKRACRPAEGGVPARADGRHAGQRAGARRVARAKRPSSARCSRTSAAC